MSRIIAICGGEEEMDCCSLEEAISIGRGLANAGYSIVTGAGHGYPDWVLQGHLVVEREGLSRRCLSPCGLSITHEARKLPSHDKVSYEYTGAGLGRSDLLVRTGDCVVAFPGEFETAAEQLLALGYGQHVLICGQKSAQNLLHFVQRLVPDSGRLKHLSPLIHRWDNVVDLILLLDRVPEILTRIEW